MTTSFSYGFDIEYSGARTLPSGLNGLAARLVEAIRYLDLSEMEATE